MNITWTSQKGCDRHANNDAVAIGYSQDYLVAVIVDAAEKIINGRSITGAQHKGKRLAQYWADTCMCEIVATNRYPNDDLLIPFLFQKQKTLRAHYLHDIASYGVLVVNSITSEFDWWYTGDCRLGIQSDQNNITWLNTPHRMENSIALLNKDTQTVINPDEESIIRHTLSRSLNARRFYQPEKLHSLFSATQSIVIATDGYWCEHLMGGTPFDYLEDDASVLIMQPGKRALKLSTDTANLLIKYC